MTEFFEFLDENLDGRLPLEQETKLNAFDPLLQADEKEAAAEGCDLEVLGKWVLEPDGRERRRTA